MTQLLAPYVPNTLARPADWMGLAHCGDDPDAMFPVADDAAAVEAALEHCADCPVRQRCLDSAMAEEGAASAATRHGIRGGLTPKNRRRLYDGKPALVDPAPRPTPPPGGGWRPAPCGTVAAYRRHRRRDEQPCALCKAARRQQSRDNRKAATTA